VRQGVNLKRDFRAAAVRIRKGVTFLKTEAARASSDTKQDLLTSARELEKLASDVEKDYKRAGHYLAASVRHFEQASAWAGHKIDSTVADVTDDARIFSEKLVKGTDWTSNEVRKAYEALGKEIEKLANTIYPGYKKVTRALKHS